MKYFFTATLLFLTTFCFSQNDLLFKKITQTDSLRIICLTDQFDSLQSYKRFTFFCKTKVAVDDVLKNFKVGHIAKEEGEDYALNMYLLKGKEVQLTQLVINPNFQNINTNVLGKFEYFTFDTIQLKNFSLKYSVNYSVKWLTFDTKKQFDNFLQTHSNDSTLLCYEDETLEHTGTGVIKIKKDKVVKDPFFGVSYIKKLLKKIPKNDNDFLIGFTPINSTYEEFGYSVQCSKELFDKIQDQRCNKIKWELNKLELLTYWTE